MVTTVPCQPRHPVLRGIRRWAVRSVLAAILPLSLAGTGIAATSAGDREQLLEGAKRLDARTSYRTYCASCHGTTGDGRGPGGERLVAIDFTAPSAVADLDREAVEAAIGQGHDEPARSAWSGKLGRSEIDGIFSYIREAFMLPSPAADASVGQQIYARTCSVCHGERGNAASWAKNSLNPPPRDFTSEKAKAMTRRQMINAVTYGNEDTAMMPFTTQYSTEEIAAVVDYIRGTFMRAAAADAAAAAGHGQSEPTQGQQHVNLGGPHAEHGHGGADGDLTAPFPEGLDGDAAKGKVLYDNNCAECHGENGAGDGPRAYFINPKPRDFTSPKARVELNRPHLFSAVSMGVKGREMAAWSKVLDDQQIADVSEYVFQEFIRRDTGTAAGGEQTREPDGEHGHDHDGHDHGMDAAPVKKN